MTREEFDAQYRTQFGGFNLLPSSIQQAILSNTEAFNQGIRERGYTSAAGWNSENNSFFSLGAEGGFSEDAYRNARWDPQHGLFLDPAQFLQVHDGGGLGGLGLLAAVAAAIYTGGASLAAEGAASLGVEAGAFAGADLAAAGLESGFAVVEGGAVAAEASAFTGLDLAAAGLESGFPVIEPSAFTSPDLAAAGLESGFPVVQGQATPNALQTAGAVVKSGVVDQVVGAAKDAIGQIGKALTGALGSTLVNELLRSDEKPAPAPVVQGGNPLLALLLLGGAAYLALR